MHSPGYAPFIFAMIHNTKMIAPTPPLGEHTIWTSRRNGWD